MTNKQKFTYDKKHTLTYDKIITTMQDLCAPILSGASN